MTWQLVEHSNVFEISINCINCIKNPITDDTSQEPSAKAMPVLRLNSASYNPLSHPILPNNSFRSLDIVTPLAALPPFLNLLTGPVR